MSGISAVSGAGMSPVWLQAQYYMHLSAARSGGAYAARANAPVEPVEPVRALPSDTPVRYPVALSEPSLPRPEDLNNASDNLARMRIVYPEMEEEAPLPGLASAAASESAARLALSGQGDAEAEAEALESIGVSDSKSPYEVMEEGKCQTCEKRKYQDGSDDPGVSFKMPTTISADQAESAVRGHEMEHVVRERARAEREGRKVVDQSVSIHTAICPECGRVYVSGGTTRTVTMNDTDDSQMLRQSRKRPGAGGFGAVA